jgi:integrase
MPKIMQKRPDATGAIPTRTRETTSQYRRRAALLFSQARIGATLNEADRLNSLVTWFTAQNRRWKSSTLRMYRAAIRTAIADALRADAINAIHAGQLIAMVETGPECMTSRTIKRTSERKRCSVAHAEIKRVVRFLEARGGETDRLLACVIGCMSLIGLRPCELLSARLDGKRLRVRCAKNTNERSIGEIRDINIENRELRAKIRCLVRQLQGLGIRDEDGARRLHNRLAKALERACKACGIKKISLYTLRHQALATAKRAMEPAEASALAGHVSQITIVRNYAPRRSGWKIKPLISIDAALAAKVRGSITFHPARAGPAAPAPGW